MKKWIQKFVTQFEVEGDNKAAEQELPEITPEKATLLYIIDTYSKHLIDMESQPIRKAREEFDEYAKSLVVPKEQKMDRILFKFRQFFSNYRIDEHTYMQKTFSDFKSIIWDFVDQLSDDVSFEENSDKDVHQNLEELKDAVEADSIESIKLQSRQFIDFYVEHQTRKDTRKAVRIKSMNANLEKIKKKLVEAKDDMRKDHLTSAFNRKSFDEQMEQQARLAKLMNSNVSLVMLDIDHFKKVNDTYGHPMGDFVIQECVRLLQETFCRENDFVARIGGEEFAVVLPDYKDEHTIHKVEELLNKVRKAVLIKEDMQVSFTISAGVAEFHRSEDAASWLKRADEALYDSKNSGRDRYSVSSVIEAPIPIKRSA